MEYGVGSREQGVGRQEVREFKKETPFKMNQVNQDKVSCFHTFVFLSRRSLSEDGFVIHFFRSFII